MPGNCGFEDSELERLISGENRNAAVSSSVVPKAIPVTSALDTKWEKPAWVSTGKLARTPDARVLSSRALRDALAALARVCFERDTPVAVMTTWDPAVTPQLLDAAARFAAKEVVSVFATSAQIRAGELAGADWRRARLFEAPAQDQSRDAMLQVTQRCAILLGGGKDVDDDAAALLVRSAQAQPGPHGPHRLFAVASTGGAAARAFQHARAAFGGNLKELELAQPTSYTVLMKRILSHTDPSPSTKHESPTGGPDGHGWSHRGGRTSPGHVHHVGQISEAVQ